MAVATAIGVALMLPTIPQRHAGAEPSHKKLIVLLCYFKGTPNPETSGGKTQEHWEEEFTSKGFSENGVYDFWNTVSNGAIDLDGTVVKPWFQVAETIQQWDSVALDPGTNTNAPGKARLCLSEAGKGIDFKAFDGFVVIDNHTILNDDVKGFGGMDFTVNGTPYSKPGMIASEGQSQVIFDHETGHSLGLDHSRALSVETAQSGQTTDYGDCYDIMSAIGCVNSTATIGRIPVLDDSAGPGLNAIQMDHAGWMPANRKQAFAPTSCAYDSLGFAPLNNPEVAGAMEVTIPATVTINVPMATGETSTSHYYSVEFRDKSGFDSGIPQDLVLLHLDGVIANSNKISHLVDSAGTWGSFSFAGRVGEMTAGSEYGDPTNQVYVGVNSIDSNTKKAVVSIGKNCRIGTHLTYTGATSTDVDDAVTLSARLTVGTSDVPVPSQPVILSFVKQTPSGEQSVGLCPIFTTTDVDGRVSCTMKLPASDTPGAYVVRARLADQLAYAGTDTDTPFTLHPEQSHIEYTGPTSAGYSDTFTASAVLTDPADNTPIVGKTVAFGMGAQDTCSATTDASGTAKCPITVTEHPGSYQAGGSFVDSPYYDASGASVPFTVTKEDTQVGYTGPTAGEYHDTLTASASLRDPDDNVPIGGKTLTFTLGTGDSCSATTDASGNASCPITSHQGGTPNLVASFGPDADYASSSAIVPLAVSPEETSLTYTGPTVVLAGAPATLSATMVEDGSVDSDRDGGSSPPTPSEPVTLGVGGQTCTAMTDNGGHVSCTISAVSVPLGPEAVTAHFAGDAYYRAADAGASGMVFAFAGPSMEFTLGDQTVAAAGRTTPVTWWADTWPSLNSLSGGPAPQSFKGLATTVTLPASTPATGCAGAWTASGGNSVAPPSTVPSYMGVVVTSAVAKSGSAISGNATHIVVVKADPGYGPSPVNHGTGVIVAVYC